MYYEEDFQCNIDINTMDATCVHYKSIVGRGFPSHAHSYYEFRYNLKGVYRAEIGNKQILLPEGSFIFIPPLTIHTFYDECRPADVLQVQFIPRMLGVAHLAHDVPVLTPYGALAEKGYVPVIRGSALHHILESMLAFCPLSELTPESPDSNISVNDFTPPIRMQQCTAIFQLISCLLDEKKIQLGYVDRHSTMYGEFQQLLEYILSNPENEMSAQRAAEFMHMSYYDFSRNFAKKCGTPYIYLVNRIKIQRAKDLLNSTSMNVTDIASLLDFSSVSYFNQVFKKYVGTAPLAYRREVHGHIQ